MTATCEFVTVIDGLLLVEQWSCGQLAVERIINEIQSRNEAINMLIRSGHHSLGLGRAYHPHFSFFGCHSSPVLSHGIWDVNWIGGIPVVTRHTHLNYYYYRHNQRSATITVLGSSILNPWNSCLEVGWMHFSGLSLYQSTARHLHRAWQLCHDVIYRGRRSIDFSLDGQQHR